MSDASAAESFFDTFLVPLLDAEEVTVGLPIARSTWSALAADVETRGNRVLSTELLLQMRASRVLPQPPILSFDQDALRLSVALYQLLFSFHAAAEQGRVSESRLTELVADTSRLLAECRPTGERGEVLRNHFLVDPFFLLYRKDVEIFFRLGAKRFYGQEVDWVRLPFRWRVQYEETVGTDVATSIFERTTGQAFASLLHLSPLTRLVRADRLFDEFEFIGLDGVLGDQALCRFAVNTIVDRGVSGFMPAFAAGWRRLLETGGRRSDVLQVARFLVALAMTREFWSPQTPDSVLLDGSYRPPTDAVRFEAPEVDEEAEQQGQSDRSQREAAARDAWSLIYVLFHEHRERLGVPQGDQQLPAAQRLGARLQGMVPSLGASLDVMRAQVGRALGPA